MIWLARHRAGQGRRRVGFAPAVLVALAVLACSPAQAARLALVIGNGAYAEGALKNPVNDARAVDRQLTALGFQVSKVENLRRADIGRTVDGFMRRIRPGDDVVVFYAGHGLQVKGVNYLPAVDASISTETEVPLNSINVNTLLENFDESKAAVRIVFLDACRNNPYARSFRSGERGLARMGAAPTGTLISFATRPGSVAADGRANGLYTAHLIRNLATENLPVELMLKRVASGVRDESGGQQDPWLEGSIEGDFFFKGAGTPIPPAMAPAKTREAGQRFRDCPDCPEMVVIPAGEFIMGSPASEADRLPSEGPQHRVRIASSFALGRTEVTVGEFGRFVQASGYRTSAEKDAGKGCVAWDKGDNNVDWRAGRNWREPGYVQGEQQPVTCVSWEDAGAYVQWLVKETGKGYRLPSEAEWEYAARAGSSSARPWGEDPKEACAHANVRDKTTLEGMSFGDPMHDCNDGYWFPAPVGNYKPNRFGLHDMIGNVWEWVQDCYQDSYTGAPADGGTWEAGKCEARVSRGGSWLNLPRGARSAIRDRLAPAFRLYNSGFRLARTLP